MRLHPRLAEYLSLCIFLLAVMSFHMVAPELGFKSMAFGIFALATLVIALIPIKWGLILAFFYIGLEGFLKVVSGYHPVIHVGADILIIFLTVKMALQIFIGQDKDLRLNPPFTLLFLLHFVWVVICLFNPYGLGLIPSLAGAKVYVTMLLMYFFAYSQTKTLKDADDFLKPLLIVVLLHTVFGIYQGMVGQESVLSLHPGYAAQMEKFKNTAFRPFGLTNLPGGPAVYMTFMFPLALYVIFTWRSWLVRITMATFLLAGVFLFLLCQIRASLIKMIIACVIFFLGTIFYSSKNRSQLRYVMVFLAVATSGMIFFLPQFLNVYMQQHEMNEMAVERSLTIFDVESLSHARASVWPRLFLYAESAPLGAGFARIGGAAVKFQKERQQDEFFHENYFFADNFWLACMVELGIPGMILLTLIILCLWYRGLRIVMKLQAFKPKMLALAIWGAMTAMIIGLSASEGMLYNPDALFFWFFSGVLMKLPLLPAETDEIKL